jgi:hypothetical protein
MAFFHFPFLLSSLILIAEIGAGVPVKPAINATVSTIPLPLPGIEIILRVRDNFLEKLIISTVPESSPVDDLVPGVGAMVLVIPVVDPGISTVPLVVSHIVFIVCIVGDYPDVLVVFSPSPGSMPAWLGQRRARQVRARGVSLDGCRERRRCTSHHAEQEKKLAYGEEIQTLFHRNASFFSVPRGRKKAIGAFIKSEMEIDILEMAK